MDKIKKMNPGGIMPGDTGGVGGALRSAVPGVSGPWSSPLFGCFDDIGICEYYTDVTLIP